MINNRTYNIVRCFFILVFAICLILFNTGCGLEAFYDIEEPNTKGETLPEANNLSDYTKRFFNFTTASSEGQSNFTFMGTDVYYKIYTNKEDWEREKSDLINASKGAVANAADKLIGTSGYGYSYQTLKIKDKNDNILIKETKSKVKIRLTNYGSTEGEYAAFLKINDTLKGKCRPVRYNNKSFDFGRVEERDKPTLSDYDIKGSSMPKDNKWIVCMFAVSKGHDDAYTPYYSNITYLGSVTIDGNEKNN